MNYKTWRLLLSLFLVKTKWLEYVLILQKSNCWNIIWLFHSVPPNISHFCRCFETSQKMQSEWTRSLTRQRSQIKTYLMRYLCMLFELYIGEQLQSNVIIYLVEFPSWFFLLLGIFYEKKRIGDSAVWYLRWKKRKNYPCWKMSKFPYFRFFLEVHIDHRLHFRIWYFDYI